MTEAPFFVKDPDARRDYRIDWSSDLEPGEMIVSHEVLAPVGIGVTDHEHDDTSVTLWLEGGQLRKRYLITIRVTTSATRVSDATISVRVAQE